jgi:hypothetical protein
LEVLLQTEDEESDSCRGGGGGSDVLERGGDRSVFFRDGRRKVDFVLVYEKSGVPGEGPDKKILKHESWRHRFMSNLVKAGLDIEQVKISFLKLYVKLDLGFQCLIHFT